MTAEKKAAEILSIMDKAAAFYLINEIVKIVNQQEGWLPYYIEEYWTEVEDIIKEFYCWL